MFDNPFATESLLRPLSNYPLYKVGDDPATAKASMLSARANQLRITHDENLPAAISAHESLAADHTALANQLSGEASEKHAAAAEAHTEAADQIKGIMPFSGNSVASNGLTGDKARAFAGMAARASNAALQATINRTAKPVNKMVEQDLFGPHAVEMAEKHDGQPDYRAMGGFHLGYGIRHHDFADQLQSLAADVRRKNGNADNAASRAWMMAATAHRDAMQAHYTAGKINDDAAYSNSKVEGASPSTHHSAGNCRYASMRAADASTKADEMTQQAQNIGTEPEDD